MFRNRSLRLWLSFKGKLCIGEMKVGAPPPKKSPSLSCTPLLQGRVLGLLTALRGQLLVELRELRLHRNADGASQEVGPP